MARRHPQQVKEIYVLLQLCKLAQYSLEGEPVLSTHVAASLGIRGFHQVHLLIGVVNQGGDVLHGLGPWRNDLPEQFCSLGVHVVHQVVQGPTGVRQHICQDSYDASSSVAMVKPGDTDANQMINTLLGAVLDQVTQALDEHLPSQYNDH